MLPQPEPCAAASVAIPGHLYCPCHCGHAVSSPTEAEAIYSGLTLCGLGRPLQVTRPRIRSYCPPLEGMGLWAGGRGEDTWPTSQGPSAVLLQAGLGPERAASSRACARGLERVPRSPGWTWGLGPRQASLRLLSFCFTEAKMPDPCGALPPLPAVASTAVVAA